MTLLSVSNVTTGYGPTTVNRDVSLTLGENEIVTILGPNGAGKSTIVKLLCRFYDPTRGAICWDGIDLRDLDPGSLRRRIGAASPERNRPASQDCQCPGPEP